MRIAVVDSGIDPDHPRLENLRCSGVSFVQDESSHVSTVTDYEDLLGHGTASAAIIYKFCREAEYVAVKIFQNELVSSEKTLSTAISWCIENSIDIINLSLGILTNSPSEELLRVCDEAHYRNIVIVAAGHHNSNNDCYPACYPSTFGVTWGNVPDFRKHGYIPDSPIEFIAKGTIQRVATIDGGYRIRSGTSLACAYFTGIVAATLESHHKMDLTTLKRHLVDNADRNIKPIQFGRQTRQIDFPAVRSNEMEAVRKQVFSSRIDQNWVGRLGVFPASEKEMRAFVELPDYASFPVTKYLDYPRKVDFRKLSLSKKEEAVSPATGPSPNSIESFDTLVLGYYSDQMFESNIRYGRSLVDKCLLENKNIFAFDFRLQSELQEHMRNHPYNGKIYVPGVTQRLFDDVMKFRYLPPVKVPVLGVIGTSNRQGKFTTQLRVKRIMENAGYRVSYLSSEPQGELFGANMTFPYGYQSAAHIEQEKWQFFLRTYLKGVSEFQRPHAILTGTQGTTIPRGNRDLIIGNETDTLRFLIGTIPDRFICAVNPQDSIGYIRNVCKVVSVFCKASPIFFVMTPWKRVFEKTETGQTVAKHLTLDEDEKNACRTRFEEALNMPVIDIMDHNNDGLILRTIEAEFS